MRRGFCSRGVKYTRRGDKTDPDMQDRSKYYLGDLLLWHIELLGFPFAYSALLPYASTLMSATHPDWTTGLSDFSVATCCAFNPRARPPRSSPVWCCSRQRRYLNHRNT